MPKSHRRWHLLRSWLSVHLGHPPRTTLNPPKAWSGFKSSLWSEHIHQMTESRYFLFRFDLHWKPFHIACHPCAIEYDVIAKLDTIQGDASLIMERLTGKPLKLKD